MLEKIITPGITIAEHTILKLSEELNIKTGGVAPSEFSTERGTYLQLLNYGLTEVDLKKDVEFPVPTPLRQCIFSNVELSDGCVYFHDYTTRRVENTIEACRFYRKKIIRNPTPLILSEFLRRNDIKTLAVFVDGIGGTNMIFHKKVKSILRQGLITQQLDFNFDL